jgi:UDP:flavonoid glycosyltransferase YjiC (YdhE family)
METVRKIAVVSFIPDGGHNQSLLRLAALIAAENKAQVACWLPEAYAPLAHSYGFDVIPLRISAPPTLKNILQRLSRRSIFYNTYTLEYELRTYYWAGLSATASNEIATVVAGLRSMAPAVIVTDAHLFQDWYKRLAAACGATLVINRGHGVRLNDAPEYVRAYGYSKLPRAQQVLVEQTGELSRTWHRIWREIRHPFARYHMRRTKRAVARKVQDTFRAYPTFPFRIMKAYTGAGALECISAGTEQNKGETEFICTKAIRDTRLPIETDLAAWILRPRSRRLIYVGFGTMVSPDIKTIRSLALGFIAADVDVLWALSNYKQTLLPSEVANDRFRFEESVPQSAVLSLKEVFCFVTHAGSGGVIEAAISGKPMLCIPYLWDQFYFASLVEKLGIGVWLSKDTLSAAGVAKALSQLVDDVSFVNQSRHLAQKLSDPVQIEAIQQWAEGVFDSTSG